MDHSEAQVWRGVFWQRQVPVIVTIVNQDDVDQLRNNAERYQLLKQATVRAAFDAYSQRGVPTCTDLGLFQRSYSRVAKITREYEAETGDIVPRRSNIHDMGHTVTHRRIICHKAYLEGKPTPVIARETCHSPEAVDNYVLDFARVYFATVQRGMSIDETTFAIQRPRYLVEEHVQMIEELGLGERTVYDRFGVQITPCGMTGLSLPWGGSPATMKDENRNPLPDRLLPPFLRGRIGGSLPLKCWWHTLPKN
jgi:hypothetical protein